MRTILHLAVSLLMWGVFGWYWYVVVERQLTIRSVEAVGLLAGISAAGLLLTIWWVIHNKRLASRNRRLQPPPTAPEQFSRDTLGRPVVAPEVAVLRRTQVVRVMVDESGNKVYTPGAEAC